MEAQIIKELSEKAVRVVQDFNYEAVWEYMIANGIKYVDGSPSISELKKTAANQMDLALANVIKTGSSTHCGTGGFNAYIFVEWRGVKLTYEPIKFKKSSY